MKKIIIFLILINSINIVNANSFSSYKNTIYNFNNESINKLILDENIISEILIDESNIYFYTDKLLYIVDKNLTIKYKININNIKKISQDNYYIYALTYFTNYKINKNNGNINYKYILNINFDNIFSYNNVSSQNIYYNISSNITNFSNYFNEIFVNKISKNNTPEIIINSDLIANNNTFRFYSLSYNRIFEISDTNKHIYEYSYNPSTLCFGERYLNTQSISNTVDCNSGSTNTYFQQSNEKFDISINVELKQRINKSNHIINNNLSINGIVDNGLRLPIKNTIINYTVLTNDYTIIANSSNQNIYIFLPNPNSIFGKILNIKRIGDNNVNVVASELLENNNSLIVLGDTSSNVNGWAQNIFYMKFIPNNNISVNRMLININSNAVGLGKTAIYNSTATPEPKNLLVQSQNLTLSNGWNYFDINSINLTSGNTYYFAFQIQSNTPNLFYKSSGGNNIITTVFDYVEFPNTASGLVAYSNTANVKLGYNYTSSISIDNNPIYNLNDYENLKIQTNGINWYKI